MKKKLESDLVSIAHRILKLEGKEDVIKMHTEVSVLFEKLSVLKYLNEKEEDEIPTSGINATFLETLDVAFNTKIDTAEEANNKTYVNLSDTEDEEDIIVPGIETIKKIVAQMPNNPDEIDVILEETNTKQQYKKNDFEDLMDSFKSMPIFEPVSKTQPGISNEKKSLNDKLKIGGFNIGLNDKIAFIKHLFEGKSEDYERVMSQLNSFDSFINAKQFILEIVKPDYNNWVNKEETEARFLEILESRFS